MRIYLASRWQNRLVLHEQRERLQAYGHEVTSRWLDEEADILPAEAAQQDLEDIESADALVLWPDLSLPVTRLYGGMFVEFGYALAQGKHLIIVGDHPCIFLKLPNVTRLKDWYDLYNMVAPVYSAIP